MDEQIDVLMNKWPYGKYVSYRTSSPSEPQPERERMKNSIIRNTCVDLKSKESEKDGGWAEKG